MRCQSGAIGRAEVDLNSIELRFWLQFEMMEMKPRNNKPNRSFQETN